MYLLVDWGNTNLKFIKVAHLVQLNELPQDVIINRVNSVESFITYLTNDTESKKIIKIIIASVRSQQDNRALLLELEKRNWSFYIAKTSQKACEVECAYKNPERLGVDRWLAIIAAFHQFKAILAKKNETRNIGIIDIGSAITLDVVSAQGQHLGGHILPSNKLLNDSLMNTANVKTELTVIKASDGFKLGQSTSECVAFATNYMILSYLINVINQSKSAYQVNHWLFTGGDSKQWYEELNRYFDNKVNIHYQPNLVLSGLAQLFLDKK